MNQQMIFLSDGGEDVRGVQLYLNPQAEHVLNWFHITMRLTVLQKCATGVKYMNKKIGEEALKTIESVKWYLWHGNVYSAIDRIVDLGSCLLQNTSWLNACGRKEKKKKHGDCLNK